MNQKVMVRNLKELERKNKILEEFDGVLMSQYQAPIVPILFSILSERNYQMLR